MMKKILALIAFVVMYQLGYSQTTVATQLQVNSAKGAAPSQAMPSNGGLSYFDANGMLKKSTSLALLGSKVSAVTATNDSTIQIVADGGTTTVKIRGIFTTSRQQWFDSLRAQLIFDTIVVQQVGIGINSVYPSANSKTLLVKGLQSSTTIGITRAADSSLIFNSLHNFTSSLTANGANVTLVGDNQTPSDGAAYGKIAGSKGWFGISQYPVATSTVNGIMDFREKLRLDSSITFVNYTTGGYDSIAIASPTLDSVILKGLKIRGASGSGITVTNVGNLFANDYSIVLDAGTWLKGQAGTAIRSGNGSSAAFTIAHGLTGVTSASAVLVTAKSTDAMGFFMATIDATNITITYASSTIPLTGTNNLTWSYLIKP